MRPHSTCPRFKPWGDSSALLVLVLFAVLGALCGLGAAGFIRGLHLAEELCDRIKSRYLRHLLGMLIVGVLMYVLLRTFGQYCVDGVGYATAQAGTGGQIPTLWLLGLLSACKLSVADSVRAFPEWVPARRAPRRSQARREMLVE